MKSMWHATWVLAALVLGTTAAAAQVPSTGFGNYGGRPDFPYQFSLPGAGITSDYRGAPPLTPMPSSVYIPPPGQGTPGLGPSSIAGESGNSVTGWPANPNTVSSGTLSPMSTPSTSVPSAIGGGPAVSAPSASTGAVVTPVNSGTTYSPWGYVMPGNPGTTPMVPPPPDRAPGAAP